LAGVDWGEGLRTDYAMLHKAAACNTVSDLKSYRPRSAERGLPIRQTGRRALQVSGMQHFVPNQADLVNHRAWSLAKM
jgi:hypothetical protein